MKKLLVMALMLGGFAAPVYAQGLTAEVYLLTPAGQGKSVGTISFEDTSKGLLVTEKLSNLPEGSHGIHIHENDNCGNAVKDGKMVLGGAAGGHYDPEHTGKHLGPNAGGHKGDLPELLVDTEGKVINSFYLSGMTTADFKGRAVIIHAGGDNYQDTPVPLGGGGDRIACGLIK